MNKILAAATICIAISTTYCSAQTTDSIKQQQTSRPQLIEQYLGIQANQLIKQIINLNVSTTAINNPYLLTYSVNFGRTALKGWGVDLGIGYNYNDEIDKNTPVANETLTNEFSYRFGISKKFKLGKRLLASVAVHFVGTQFLDKSYSISFTNLGNGIDSTTEKTTTRNSSYGVGPQLSLSYLITRHLLLGTEASYYFTWSTQKQNVDDVINFTDTNTGLPSTSLVNTNTESDIKQFVLEVPVALFLILKF